MPESCVLISPYLTGRLTSLVLLHKCKHLYQLKQSGVPRLVKSLTAILDKAIRLQSIEQIRISNRKPMTDVRERPNECLITDTNLCRSVSLD